MRSHTPSHGVGRFALTPGAPMKVNVPKTPSGRVHSLLRPDHPRVGPNAVFTCEVNS
jgi:hypothetical protein